MVMVGAEEGFLVQAAFCDEQGVGSLVTAGRALVSFPIANPVLLVFFSIHGHAEDYLFEIGQAGDGASFCTGLREGGQQHGGENRDDGDDDEEFNQREVLLFHVSDSFVIWGNKTDKPNFCLIL